MSLEQLLRPRSVAVYGASRSLDKFGGRVVHNLIRNGFAGELVPVNRSGGEVQAVPAFASLEEYGKPVDAAILAVPTDGVLGAARECADAGVGSVIVIGTGFGELGADGRALQDELLGVCRTAGMRLLGPNCLGVINVADRAVLTSSISLTVGSLPTAGGVAFVSQSGAIMVSAFDYARHAGIGLSLCVSVGNQADVDLCDVLEDLADDERTSAICVYAEGFSDPNRLLQVARSLHERGTALFMVKAGRTPAGVVAAQSHTASLAGSYQVAAAALGEAGVVLANDPLAMLGAAGVRAQQGTARATGIAISSGSGGAISIAVDAVVEAGLELAVLNEETRSALAPHVAQGHRQNPIDLGFRLESNPVSAARPIVTAICADPSVGACMLLLGSTPFLPQQTRAMAEPVLASGALLLAVVDPGEVADEARAVLRELGCPSFGDVDSALRAARVLLRPATVVPPGAPAPGAFGNEVADVLAGLPPGYVPEAAAKTLLVSAGIPVNRGEVVTSLEQARSVAQRLAGPIVLKVAGDGIVHKSAAGGVALDIRDAPGLHHGWTKLAAASGQPPDGEFPVLVQEMITGAVAELIVGVRVDPQFGPVVLVGSGGVFTEVLADTALATAPVARSTVEGLLRSLRIWPTLQRAIERSQIHLSSVVDVVERMGWLAAAFADRIESLEVNPLLLGGSAAVAVDARAVVRG